MPFPEHVVLFRFLAGLLIFEPTVVRVDTVVSDAGAFLSTLSFHIELLQLMDATRAP